MESRAGDHVAELKKLAAIISDSIAERVCAPARLATLAGVSDRDARNIAFLRNPLYPDSSAWNMSTHDTVTLLVDAMLPSVYSSQRFASEEHKQLHFLRTLIDFVVESRAYTPRELAASLTRVPTNDTSLGTPEGIDPNQISLAYLIHTALIWSPRGRDLSITQLVPTVSEGILNDPRFDSLLTQEDRAAITEAEGKIA